LSHAIIGRERLILRKPGAIIGREPGLLVQLKNNNYRIPKEFIDLTAI